MDYKHECYDGKVTLADDEFLPLGENAEALRSDLQIRFNAGERLITTQECPEFSPVKGCPGTIARLSMSNPFDLSMYALVGVMAIIAVASTVSKRP